MRIRMALEALIFFFPEGDQELTGIIFSGSQKG